MPQHEHFFPTASSHSTHAAPSGSQGEEEKWPSLATLLFVVLLSSAGWAVALYPVLR